MNTEVKGTIKKIEDTKTFGTSGFRKREVVITTDDQYPQSILIEFIQDKCELLDVCKIGQDVKISYNLRGKEWVNPEGETKYFNSIQGWKIEILGKEIKEPTELKDSFLDDESDKTPF